ncbi:MAG: excalibur calcium-binding domain-containing protein [Streptomyces sp.]|nr:excalibur calcium-binding domain-containing protein [Streptomyces sp.]NUS31285.1 excalibur calcium-binding domain-containing protein [Streptomyces sp.]
MRGCLLLIGGIFNPVDPPEREPTPPATSSSTPSASAPSPEQPIDTPTVTATTTVTEAPPPAPTKTLTKTAEAPEPTTNSPGADVYYDNCDEAHVAGDAPLDSGDPGYGPHLDRDGDGVACEPYLGP